MLSFVAQAVSLLCVLTMAWWGGWSWSSGSGGWGSHDPGWGWSSWSSGRSGWGSHDPGWGWSSAGWGSRGAGSGEGSRKRKAPDHMEEGKFVYTEWPLGIVAYPDGLFYRLMAQATEAGCKLRLAGKSARGRIRTPTLTVKGVAALEVYKLVLRETRRLPNFDFSKVAAITRTVSAATHLTLHRQHPSTDNDAPRA